MLAPDGDLPAVRKQRPGVAAAPPRRQPEAQPADETDQGLGEVQKGDDRALSNAPELRDWSGAKRGAFYRPVKQQITLRLDADVVAWFKENAPGGRGYQTDINRALRDYVDRQED